MSDEEIEKARKEAEERKRRQEEDRKRKNEDIIRRIRKGDLPRPPDSWR